MESDAAYFGRRAQQESAAAMKAAHPAARRSHKEMAARYKELASALLAYHRTVIGPSELPESL